MEIRGRVDVNLVGMSARQRRDKVPGPAQSLTDLPVVGSTVLAVLKGVKSLQLKGGDVVPRTVEDWIHQLAQTTMSCSKQSQVRPFNRTIRNAVLAQILIDCSNSLCVALHGAGNPGTVIAVLRMAMHWMGAVLGRDAATPLASAAERSAAMRPLLLRC